jgi:hypothetical protein
MYALCQSTMMSRPLENVVSDCADVPGKRLIVLVHPYLTTDLETRSSKFNFQFNIASNAIYAIIEHGSSASHINSLT